MRHAKQYLLLDPDDCLPPHGLDLEPGSRDSLKVENLTQQFITSGFDVNQPALIGYPLNGKIQLVSGTHRREAAKRAGIMLPVRLTLRSIVEGAWGTEKWLELLEDTPVKDLEMAPIKEYQDIPGLDERIDLSRDYK